MSGLLMNFANFTGICVAMIFGIISPNNTRMNVTIIELTTNSITGLVSRNGNMWPIIIEEISTIRMFTQLFICRIVARRWSGLPRRRKMNALRLSCSALSLSSCFGDSEKKEVSLPEMRAEQPKRRIRLIPKQTISIVKLLGGSKI